MTRDTDTSLTEGLARIETSADLQRESKETVFLMMSSSGLLLRHGTLWRSQAVPSIWPAMRNFRLSCLQNRSLLDNCLHSLPTMPQLQSLPSTSDSVSTSSPRLISSSISTKLPLSTLVFGLHDGKLSFPESSDPRLSRPTCSLRSYHSSRGHN